MKKLNTLRWRIWRFIKPDKYEGMSLPWWLLYIKAILFPIKFLYSRISRSQGYQFGKGTWKIKGMEFTESSIRELADTQYTDYTVLREGDYVFIYPTGLFNRDNSIHKCLSEATESTRIAKQG